MPQPRSSSAPGGRAVMTVGLVTVGLVAVALAGAGLSACGRSHRAGLFTTVTTTTTTTTSPPTTTAASTTTTVSSAPASSAPASSTPASSTPASSTPVSSTPASSTTTSSTALSAPTTGHPVTTTGPWRPLAAAPSAYQAADELFAAWQVHNRAQALTVATAGAVSALFALRYPDGGVQQRGCTSPPGTLPSTCVYRYGTAVSILSLTVTPFSNGWGVTGVALES